MFGLFRTARVLGGQRGVDLTLITLIIAVIVVCCGGTLIGVLMDPGSSAP